MTAASSPEEAGNQGRLHDPRTVSLLIAKRAWTTFFWGSQIFVWGLQILIRLDDDGGPQWLFYTSVAFFCVSIAGLVSTRFVRVEYDARGVTFRCGPLRWGHLPWTDVVQIVPARGSTGGLDLRTIKENRTLSTRPNEIQLEALHAWHAAAQETKETGRDPRGR